MTTAAMKPCGDKWVVVEHPEEILLSEKLDFDSAKLTLEDWQKFNDERAKGSQGKTSSKSDKDGKGAQRDALAKEAGAKAQEASKAYQASTSQKSDSLHYAELQGHNTAAHAISSASSHSEALHNLAYQRQGETRGRARAILDSYSARLK